jgi:hypothetical protein
LLTEIGYNLHLNSAGVFEAKFNQPASNKLASGTQITTTSSTEIVPENDEANSSEQSY